MNAAHLQVHDEPKHQADPQGQDHTLRQQRLHTAVKPTEPRRALPEHPAMPEGKEMQSKQRGCKGFALAASDFVGKEDYFHVKPYL